jgi:hypothetical protein
VRQYGRPHQEVFPVGMSAYNQPFGSQVSLPVPFRERNNPNWTPSACDPTRA